MARRGAIWFSAASNPVLGLLGPLRGPLGLLGGTGEVRLGRVDLGLLRGEAAFCGGKLLCAIRGQGFAMGFQLVDPLLQLGFFLAQTVEGVGLAVDLAGQFAAKLTRPLVDHIGRGGTGQQPLGLALAAFDAGAVLLQDFGGQVLKLGKLLALHHVRDAVAVGIVAVDLEMGVDGALVHVDDQPGQIDIQPRCDLLGEVEEGGILTVGRKIPEQILRLMPEGDDPAHRDRGVGLHGPFAGLALPALDRAAAHGRAGQGGDQDAVQVKAGAVHIVRLCADPKVVFSLPGGGPHGAGLDPNLCCPWVAVALIRHDAFP